MGRRFSGAQKVLGGHQEGAPSWPRPAGGEGAAGVRVEGLHQAGAGGRLLRTWGALPSPFGDTLPTSSAPCLVPRRLRAPRGLLGPRRGEVGE